MNTKRDEYNSELSSFNKRWSSHREKLKENKKDDAYCQDHGTKYKNDYLDTESKKHRDSHSVCDGDDKHAKD